MNGDRVLNFAAQKQEAKHLPVDGTDMYENISC